MWTWADAHFLPVSGFAIIIRRSPALMAWFTAKQQERRRLLRLWYRVEIRRRGTRWMGRSYTAANDLLTCRHWSTWWRQAGRQAPENRIKYRGLVSDPQLWRYGNPRHINLSCSISDLNIWKIILKYLRPFFPQFFQPKSWYYLQRPNPTYRPTEKPSGNGVYMSKRWHNTKLNIFHC